MEVVVVVVVVGPIGPPKETAERRWCGSHAEEDQRMHGRTFPEAQAVRPSAEGRGAGWVWCCAILFQRENESYSLMYV